MLIVLRWMVADGDFDAGVDVVEMDGLSTENSFVHKAPSLAPSALHACLLYII
jgi:hypothetical protein